MTIQEGIWSENCLITITDASTDTDYQFAAMTADIRMTEGDKDFDEVVNLKGGRLRKRTPQGPIEVELTCYPIVSGVGATASTARGVSSFFDRKREHWDTADTSISILGRGREMYRIVILWTDDTSVTSAASATTSGNNALRYILHNANCTQHNFEFTGDGLKVSLKFKASVFRKNGWSNRQIQSNATTGSALTALGTYATGLAFDVTEVYI